VQGIVLPAKSPIFPRRDDNTSTGEPLIVSVDLSRLRLTPYKRIRLGRCVIRHIPTG
jgi:hypothetical protein